MVGKREREREGKRWLEGGRGREGDNYSLLSTVLKLRLVESEHTQMLKRKLHDIC